MRKLSVVRELAAEHINAVVNHDDVRPWVGLPGQGYLDLTAIVADPRNALLMGEHGGCLFIELAPGLYEVHTQFLPEGRGADAVAVVKDALWWMFTRTPCMEIVTKVPDHNRGALGLVRSIGGHRQFHRPFAWPTDQGAVGVAYYSQTLAQWVEKTDALVEVGEAFHQKLAAAKASAGAAPLHDDDDAHDRYVGATVEMVLAGQVAKGLDFYRRWALFSGYVPATLIAVNPTTIDIGDAILAARGDSFDVLLCR